MEISRDDSQNPPRVVELMEEGEEKERKTAIIYEN